MNEVRYRAGAHLRLSYDVWSEAVVANGARHRQYPHDPDTVPEQDLTSCSLHTSLRAKHNSVVRNSPPLLYSVKLFTVQAVLRLVHCMNCFQSACHMRLIIGTLHNCKGKQAGLH